MAWDFHTHGWAHNMVHPGLARNHVPYPLAHAAHGPSGPARSHSACQARHAPRTGTPPVVPHTAHMASLVQYGSASGCARPSQVAPDPSQPASQTHRPSSTRARPPDSDKARLARVTPFASHLLTCASRGQGVFLQMGGPPNTFTGATQPIPVGSDGSVQAGLPDANAGRDTRGVVNKYSTPRCVSPHAMRLRVR